MSQICGILDLIYGCGFLFGFFLFCCCLVVNFRLSWISLVCCCVLCFYGFDANRSSLRPPFLCFSGFFSLSVSLAARTRIEAGARHRIGSQAIENRRVVADCDVQQVSGETHTHSTRMKQMKSTCV